MCLSTRLAASCASLIFTVFAISPADAKDPEPSPSFAVPVPAAEELAQRIKRQHPRLLIDAAGFDALGKKIAVDPLLKQWDAKILRDANRCLTMKLPEHVLPDGLRLLDTSRRTLEHSYTLAM